MIYWSLKALNAVAEVDHVIVATDSEEIEATVNSFDFKKVVIYKRSPENALDASSTESVMLEYLKQENWPDTTAFILTQATSPLTQSQHFKAALHQFHNKGCDSLLTACRSKRFFWKADGTAINYDYKNRPRRQDFDGYLMENGAFYINSVGQIKRDQNRLSGKIALYEMPEYTALELDEPHDWIIGEELLKKYIIGNE